MTQNLVICLDCQHRAQTWTPPIRPCTVDGRDIMEHARNGDCPYDFFRTRAEEAKLIAAGVPTNRKPQNEPGGCGC